MINGEKIIRRIVSAAIVFVLDSLAMIYIVGNAKMKNIKDRVRTNKVSVPNI